ncbi:MAG: type VI secretion system baseplate subunit TssG [Halomonadaceae bacterium]|nr:MAG: type VI secretion system baseplate subunit TssG [Halomonadaceae bacterium]
MNSPIKSVPERSQGKPGQDLFREVWRIERQIGGQRSPWHRVGHDGWPQQELVRFRTSRHMGFPGQDLVKGRLEDTGTGVSKAELTLDCLGLTGARGALPAHYTELVLSQLRSRSPALGDFLDLFNHRLLSLFYRSWEKTRPAVQQERDPDDVFTGILRALTGCSEDWEIYYGAALARGPRSQSQIQAVLQDLTAMEVTVCPLQGGWQGVNPEDQTRLPDRQRPQGQYARLGEALLGQRSWMADQGAGIVFHPENATQLADLLPGGRYSEAVGQLTSKMVGQMSIRWRLQADASQLPGTTLGRQGRLGSDSFISSRRATGRRVEISFKPGKDA